MSLTNEQILQRLTELVNWKNALVSNSKTTGELELMDPVDRNGVLRIAIGATSKKLPLQNLVDNIAEDLVLGNVPAKFKQVTIDFDVSGSTISKVRTAINANANYVLEQGTLYFFFVNRIVLTNGDGISVAITPANQNPVSYAVIQEFFVLTQRVNPNAQGVASLGVGGTPLTTNGLRYFNTIDNRSFEPIEFDLGDIGTTVIEDSVNSGGPFSTPNGVTVIFRAIQNGQEELWLYLGGEEEIGNGFPNVLDTDFRMFPNEDNADPPPAYQESLPFQIMDLSTGNINLENFEGTLINQSSPNTLDIFTIGNTLLNGKAEVLIDTAGKTEFPVIQSNYEMLVTGGSGDGVITIDGVDYPITFNTDAATTATDFKNTEEADILLDRGVTVAVLGDVIYFVKDSYFSLEFNNTSGDLFGDLTVKNAVVLIKPIAFQADKEYQMHVRYNGVVVQYWFDSLESLNYAEKNQDNTFANSNTFNEKTDFNGLTRFDAATLFDERLAVFPKTSYGSVGNANVFGFLVNNRFYLGSLGSTLNHLLIDFNNLSANRTLTAPDKDGTIATTDDVDALISGYQGSISTTDTPTVDGYYTPTQDGTYNNFGGLTYDTDGVDGGKLVFFIKTGSTYTKLPIDLNTGTMLESEYLDEIKGKNLFDKTKVVDGQFLNNSGVVSSAVGWGRSDYIKINEGDTYTLSGVRGRHGLAYFANYGDTSPVGSYSSSTSLPFTSVAPTGANYVVFNLYSASSPIFSNIQFELGSSATSYAPYVSYNKIKTEFLPDNAKYTNTVVIDDSSDTASFLKLEINGKELRQNIRAFPPGTNPFDVAETYFDDVLVRSTSDDTAPYRLDGNTIGANHQGGGDNSLISRKIYIDGNEVLKGEYTFKDNLSVIEKYTLTGNNTTGAIAEISYTFVFDKYGNTVIYTDIYALQSVALTDIMFTQAAKVSGEYFSYVPKSLPFTQDGVNYDFSSPFDMIGFAPTNRLNFTPSRCDPNGQLCDRVISIRNDINFSIGYIPIQAADPSARRTNAARKALEIRNNTGKIYMSAVDSASIPTLNAGDYYSAVCYKSYSVPVSNTINSNFIPTKQGFYVYLDWDAFTGIDKIEMPEETIGKSMTVIEKSASIELKTLENTGTMIFDVNTKGYAVLKFD